jgi:hypothetical protein
MQKLIVDIDGTLCESLFANCAHNDNERVYTDEFRERLKKQEPFPWTKTFPFRDADEIHVITGRDTRVLLETCKFLKKVLRCDYTIEFLGWDDSYPTREASYHDYVARKVAAIRAVGKPCIVIEDDQNVINAIRDDLFMTVVEIVKGEVKI